MATSKPSVKEVKIKLTGEYGKGFKDIVANIKELNSNLGEVTRNFKTFTEGLKNNTSVATKEVSEKLEEVNKEVKKTGEETKKAADGAKGLGKAFEGLGARIRTFAQYRIINIMTQSVINLSKAAIELESNFANIQAITSASDTEMEKLRGTILRVGEASKYSVEEIAKATTMLGQAGLSADEINNVLETTTQLAAGTGSELSNTVDLMTSALAVWGLNSEEASHLSDVMVTGMNRTKATLETFRMAVQYAGATMASLNVSFDEFASVAAAASNAGLRASVVGTGLRAMTSELISPTKKMVRGLAELGLSTEDVNIESQGLVNVLYKLKNAGLTAANAYDLFGKRAAQFVLAAQGQLDVVDELRVAFNESGATLKAYGTQMDTISAQATALGNTLKEMAANILDSISWMIKGTLKGINRFLKDMIWLFSDKEKIKFEELKKEIDDSKLAVKTFYDFVKNLSERDYGKDTTKAMEDLNKIIDKINRKFKLNIEHVNSVDKLTDAYKDLLKVLKDIDKEQNEQKNQVRGERQSQLLNEVSSFDFARSTGLKLTDSTEREFKNYRRLYLYKIQKADGDIDDIADEIENMRDAARRKLHQYALEDAKRIYDEIGKKSETTYTSNELDNALDELESESKAISTTVKNFTNSMNDRIKKSNEALYETSQLSLDEVNKISEQAKNAEIEFKKINDRSQNQWDQIFKEKGIINEDEQKQYQQKIKEIKKKDIESYLGLLNEILNTAQNELETKISTPVTKAIIDKIEPQIKNLKDINKSPWESYISNLSNDGKPKGTTPTYRGDAVLDRAKKFNEKYLAQESALQNQKYGSDKERARRQGFLSRLSDVGLDSSLLTSEYAKLSELEDKRTAKTQLNLLESYKKDYDDLYRKAESGQITLQEADRQSASLISKMRDLEVQTTQAKARFVDLDEQSLEDIQNEIDKTKDKTKELEEQSQTTWGQFSGGFKKAIKDMADNYTATSVGKFIAEDLGNGMADALNSIVDGSKSAKDAFSDMARSILKDISKMLIKMAVLKAMEVAVGMSDGGQVPSTNPNPEVVLGGEYANGGFIPKIRAALGTPVRGGIPGKDSVPAMLMPGEYVLKKSAVDALGTNFLNDLNNNAAQTLTNTSANLLQNSYESGSESEPTVVNVWVVSKEEEAQMGPNDVIATISKDIMTGGQTRRLIQSVVAGRK